MRTMYSNYELVTTKEQIMTITDSGCSNAIMTLILMTNVTKKWEDDDN